METVVAQILRIVYGARETERGSAAAESPAEVAALPKNIVAPPRKAAAPARGKSSSRGNGSPDFMYEPPEEALTDHFSSLRGVDGTKTF